MWCSRGCLGPPASSDACLWHVSLGGGARRRGCAAAGVSVIFNRLLGDEGHILPHAEYSKGVVVASSTKPSRLRIGRLAGSASTCRNRKPRSAARAARYATSDRK